MRAKLRRTMHNLARSMPLTGRNDRYRRFLILSRARSGSTMLVRRLDHHPQIDALGEIFLPDSLDYYGHHVDRWWLPPTRRHAFADRMMRERDTNPARFAERLAWGVRPRGIRAAGFKMLWSQLLQFDEADRRALLGADDLHVILLERHDALRQFLSETFAERHGFRHLSVGTARTVLPAIDLDPASFDLFVARRKYQTTLIRTLTRHLPRRIVAYEDLVTAADEENAGLCAFLGVEDQALPDGVQLISAAPLHERIANFDAFCGALRGTAMEPWLSRAGIRH